MNTKDGVHRRMVALGHPSPPPWAQKPLQNKRRRGRGDGGQGAEGGQASPSPPPPFPLSTPPNPPPPPITPLRKARQTKPREGGATQKPQHKKVLLNHPK